MNQKDVVAARKEAEDAAIEALGDRLDVSKAILKKAFEKEINQVLSQSFREKYSVQIVQYPSKKHIFASDNIHICVSAKNGRIFSVYRISDYYGKLGWSICREGRKEVDCFYEEIQSVLEELIERPWD